MEINNSKKVWIISYSPYKHPINILPCAIIQHPICVKEHQLKVNNQQQTFQPKSIKLQDNKWRQQGGCVWEYDQSCGLDGQNTDSWHLKNITWYLYQSYCT